MSSDTAPRLNLACGARWRVVPGVEVRARGSVGETAVYFGGPGETMVVNELGATAIDGLEAGCSDLPALEGWCRDHGFAEAGDELADGLSALLSKLIEFEIIELRP